MIVVVVIALVLFFLLLGACCGRWGQITGAGRYGTKDCGQALYQE